jgi:hypothetical protein
VNGSRSKTSGRALRKDLRELFDTTVRMSTATPYVAYGIVHVKAMKWGHPCSWQDRLPPKLFQLLD